MKFSLEFDDILYRGEYMPLIKSPKRQGEIIMRTPRPNIIGRPSDNFSHISRFEFRTTVVRHTATGIVVKAPFAVYVGGYHEGTLRDYRYKRTNEIAVDIGILEFKPVIGEKVKVRISYDQYAGGVKILKPFCAQIAATRHSSGSLSDPKEKTTEKVVSVAPQVRQSGKLVYAPARSPEHRRALFYSEPEAVRIWLADCRKYSDPAYVEQMQDFNDFSCAMVLLWPKKDVREIISRKGNSNLSALTPAHVARALAFSLFT